jgi:hypothetical protein
MNGMYAVSLAARITAGTGAGADEIYPLLVMVRIQTRDGATWVDADLIGRTGNGDRIVRWSNGEEEILHTEIEVRAPGALVPSVLAARADAGTTSCILPQSKPFDPDEMLDAIKNLRPIMADAYDAIGLHRRDLDVMRAATGTQTDTPTLYSVPVVTTTHCPLGHFQKLKRDGLGGFDVVGTWPLSAA